MGLLFRSKFFQPQDFYLFQYQVQCTLICMTSLCSNHHGARTSLPGLGQIVVFIAIYSAPEYTWTLLLQSVRVKDRTCHLSWLSGCRILILYCANYIKNAAHGTAYQKDERIYVIQGQFTSLSQSHDVLHLLSINSGQLTTGTLTVSASSPTLT